MVGSRVVFIDADPASRKFVATVLREHGYEVEAASSAERGISAAKAHSISALVVDPVGLELTAVQLASRLRGDPVLAGVPLIALSVVDDPEQHRAWAEAGFVDCLVKSPDVMPSLVRSLSDHLGGIETAARQSHGALLAFLSAKGGTGTSTLCANLAMTMAHERADAHWVVADLVLPVGSICGIVGCSGHENIVSLSNLPAAQTTPEHMRRNLPEARNWGFRLLAGSPDPEVANELNVARIEPIVATLQEAFDFVIIDLGRSLSRISLPLIQRADLIVMIVGTDMSTVTLSKTVWEYLRGKGVQPDSVYAILNRAVGLQGVTKAEAEGIIGLPIRTAVPYLSENLTLANNLNSPYSTKYPGDTASIILRETAREMIDLTMRRHSRS